MAHASNQSLKDHVVLVTGASSGIGRASALELARRGAKVVVSARRMAPLADLVAQIKAEGFEATAVGADINVEQDVIALVAKAVSTYGRLDAAFNNAGTEGQFSPFVEQSNDVYDTIFNANVRGVFWSMKHEAKAMLAQGGGSIVNNASMGGVIGFGNAALYVASKHAVIGLTNRPHQDGIHRIVQARHSRQCRLPGPDRYAVPRPNLAVARGQGEIRQKLRSRAAWGTSEEIAAVVAFLASSDSSFVSGHSLLADGGYSVA
ncbi:MAG: SDR family NAD(P)-dependent oxidoreductase [Rhizomicrobium sp.]